MIKNVNAIQTTDTSDFVEMADYNTNIYEIKNNIPNHDKYITAQEKLTYKSDTADFVKETDFDEKLKK